jgi:hypothetical protein
VRPAAHPQQHKALIGNDPRHPCGEFRVTLVLIQVLIGLHESILRLVFRISPISEKKAAQVDASSPVPPNQLAEGLLVSLTR